MSESITAEEDSSPLTSGYSIGKIAVAIVLAAVMHAILLGSSLLIGSSKKPQEQAASKGPAVPAAATATKTGVGTETESDRNSAEKKTSDSKPPAAAKGDAADDLKLDDK
jgi:hypothetical protein